MPQITLFYGLALIVLGVAGYFLTGRESVTALIPSFFGIPITLLGMVAAANPGKRKLVMHIAVFLGVLGAAGSARGLSGFMAVLSGGEVERPAAAVAQGIMFILSVAFVLLCVRSFMAARKAN